MSDSDPSNRVAVVDRLMTGGEGMSPSDAAIEQVTG